MPITFNDPAVAAKYETDQTADKTHHLPGGKQAKGWKGKLSNIPLVQADRWISRPKQNLLKLKVEPAATKKESKKEEPK